MKKQIFPSVSVHEHIGSSFPTKYLCSKKYYYCTVGLLVSVFVLHSLLHTDMLVMADEPHAFECDCPTTDGETELQQMSR